MSIKENLAEVRRHIPDHVELVVVSKTMPVEKLMEVYDCGERIFGENKVQELILKQPLLPADIHWHLIGHLQTNKVKYIAPFVHMIHSVDSLKLLEEINRQAGRNHRVIPCLLQFHIAEEETKFGLDEAEGTSLLAYLQHEYFPNIAIHGVMGMATYTYNIAQITREFRHLKQIFDQLKTTFFLDDPDFRHISMGMSDDFEIAIDEGATLVRIGTLIFGE
ncbi:MAG: YggS family pyridoxal phosphate-dependent enzyme, partial [Bacteroidales bacterium]